MPTSARPLATFKRRNAGEEGPDRADVIWVDFAGALNLGSYYFGIWSLPVDHPLRAGSPLDSTLRPLMRIQDENTRAEA